MNFIEAVKLLQLDKNISMKRNNGYFEITSSVGHLSLSGELYSPMTKDILAEDWYIVKDEKLHSFEEALKSYHKGNIIYYHEDNVPYPAKFCTKVTDAYVDISNCVVRNMYDEKVESYMFAPKRILSNRWIIEERDQND